MATTDQLLNTLFDGRYRIVRKLGSGGMANVYLAEDQELGRRVAIKILNDRHAGDEQFVERFRREAKNAAGLSHPNIVSIYDRGEAEGTYYIAMEYLDGRSLKELILSRGPAPVSVAVDYARQILSALRFAHRNGIVHRDIKPHNCLVDAEGHVKVTDFGIARAGASQMTEAGSIIGTAQYLSPEQARGTQVDQRSDLYSLGIVLYEMLTGNVPFNGDSPVEIAMKHLSATPPPLSAKRPDIPKSLEMVVLRALAKDPAARYQSTDEMDADLERVGRGHGVSRETEDAGTTAPAADGRLLRLPRAGAATLGLAVAARGPAGRGGRDRRLLRLPPDPGSAEPGEARRRARSGWDQRSQRRARHPRSGARDRSRAHPPPAGRHGAKGLRLRSEPECGRPRRQGQLRRVMGVDGQEAGDRPRALRRDTRRRGREARLPEARPRRAPDSVQQAEGHRDRPKTRRESEGRREDNRAHQRVERPEADRRAQCERTVVRLGGLAAASPGLRRRAQGRELRPGVRGNRDRAGPGGQHVRGEGLHDHAHGLEGTGDHRRAERREHGRADREEPARGVRLQGEGDEGGHGRPVARGHRHLAGSRRRHAGETENDGDDRRGSLQGAAGRRHHDRDYHDDPGPVSRCIRVAVLAGGRSSEHEISLASARSVLEALDPARYETVTVAIGRD